MTTRPDDRSRQPHDPIAHEPTAEKKPPVAKPVDTAGSSVRLGSRQQRELWKDPRVLAAVGVGFVLLLLVGLWFAGSDEDLDPGNEMNSRETGDSDIPLPEVETGEIKIYSVPPGFAVLVDGQPVRDRAASAEVLRTPCAVTASQGMHTITLAKEGFLDKHEEVAVREMTSVIRVSPRADAAGDATGVLHGKFFAASVGEPIPLDSVNTPGREFDPFVTRDGLALWFAADRGGEGGIYLASRSTPFAKFSQPRLIRLSMGRGDDRPASPSVTPDGRLIAYTVPRKARIRGLARAAEQALGGYERLIEIRHSDDLDAYWPVAQLLADDISERVKIYWTEIAGKETQSFVATRVTPRSSFQDVRKLSFPGGIPCLSTDGLRQYVFDGKTLRRARRADSSTGFSEPKTIATLDLPEYRPNPRYRQFFVSDDEQWLYYCPDPEANADLFVVRLAEAPGWGFIATGESIEDLPALTQSDPLTRGTGDITTPLTPESEANESPKTNKPDPRSTPLAYGAHWKEFQQLLGERKYDDAARLLDAHAQDPAFAEDREVLAWDRELLANIRGFWDDVRRGIGTLEPGDEYDQSSVSLKFEKFENDVLTGRLNDREVVKPIVEFKPSDLLAFADRAIERNDQDGQRRMALFLANDGQAIPQQANTRFERAGDARAEYQERLAARILHQAEREIGRNNPAAGLEFIAQLRERYPESAAAKKSQQVETSLYDASPWKTYGSRKWKRGPLGEYTAEPQRVANSFLVAPGQYERFELRMEWKVTNAATSFGGVFFRWNALTGQPYEPNASFKIPLGNDYGIAPDPTVSGGLFQIEAPRENAVKPAGQWNTCRIRVNGDQVDVWINGKHVLDTITRNDQVSKKGGVLLDGVSGGISYRKILLMDLPE